MVTEIKNDLSGLPFQIQGRILDPNSKIEDIQVADGELILLEMKIHFEEDHKTPYVFNPTSEKRQKVKGGLKLPQAYAAAANDTELMAMPLDDFFENPKSKCGLTGLQNLGNTCFMNCVLQGLANTEPLVKFFLYQMHLNQINDKNTYGTRGRLALAFGELVNELYAGTHRSLAPWDVKSWVARKAIQFQGFAQHDCQEMLSVLLETMHEDCNSISKKPYIE
jgi:ubiquitin C-terminal hydrolase